MNNFCFINSVPHYITFKTEIIKECWSVALKGWSIYIFCTPVTGLEWPRSFQEVKVPRFRDNGTGWW